jgi:hypothetical protein
MSNMTHLAAQTSRTAGLVRAVSLILLTGLASPLSRSAEPVLKVAAPGQSLDLTAEELSALPHVEITALDPHEKKEHRYSGVPVREILARVGEPSGDKIRGPALATAVIIHSKDGYTTLFALAEFDDQFNSRTILLSDGQDGKPLPPNLGPLHIVVPGDKRAARWARMVTSIEIVQLPTAKH